MTLTLTLTLTLTQEPPIRAAHAFIDCPKRRKACVREYTAEAMQQAMPNPDPDH